MNRKFAWYAIAAMVTILGLARLAQPVNARQSEEPTSSIVRGPVSWTLTPAQCPNINLTITGTGTQLEVITARVLDDGTKESITSNFVTGTATDTNGGTYNFSYSNQDGHIQPRGRPVQVHMIDTFDLNGNGGVNSLNLGFEWSWSYTPPGEQEWPPVHNWQQIQTLGDPLDCDPI